MPPSPRRKRISAAQQRRNARARALGFRNDYERRTRGKPGAGKPSSEELRRRRGHPVGPEEFLDFIQPGDEVMLADHISKVDKTASGKFGTIRKLVVPKDVTRQPREFVIQNLTKATLRAMIQAEIAAGGELTPQPSLDQRRLL